MASGNGAVHIAFGVTMPKPLDLVLRVLWQYMVMCPEFRANLTVNPDEDALAQDLRKIGEVFKVMVESKEVRTAVAEYLKEFVASSKSYDITKLIADDVHYQIVPGIKLAKKNGKTLLGKGKTWVEVPEGLEEPIAWVLERDEVTEQSLSAAFSAMDKGAVAELIGNLRSMSVLR